MASAAVGAGATYEAKAVQERRPLPFYGGTASLLPPAPDTPVAHSLQMVWEVKTARRAIALTFDDGPHPQRTPQVLAALRDADVPATFFLKGTNVVEHGALHGDSVGRHELGCHLHHHVDCGRLDFEAARREIVDCASAMHNAYGLTPTLFRPPYGHASAAALLAAASQGMTTVLWGGRFRESRFHDNPDGVVPDALGQMRPGIIFLGHDTGTDERVISIERLPHLLARLKDDGWTFHTVSQLLALGE